MKEKVIALTLNFNQSKMTIECVNSLIQSDHENLLIYIVDNGSEIEDYEYLTKAIAKIEDNRIILKRISPNRNYVGGMNYALEIANKCHPDYFLVVNNDTNIDKEAIKELVLSSKKFNNDCLVTGKVYEYDKPNIIQTLGSKCIKEDILLYNNIGKNENDVGQYDQEKERDMIDDVFWLLPAKVFNTVGYYNPAFSFNGESADYALRVKKTGCKLIYCPKAKLWHKGGLSIGGRKNNPYLSYWQTRSTLTFRYIHLKKSSFIRFEFRIVRMIIYKYLKFILGISTNKTNLKLINATVKGLYDFHKIAKKDLRLQKKDN